MGSLQADPTGERPLLPSLVDRAAAENPQRVFCYSPKGSKYSDGWTTVRMPDLARAVNRGAHWLVDTLGAPNDFETLAYMGPNDARYFILILASVKAGFRLLLPSLRNSVVNHLHVLDATECTMLLHACSIGVGGLLKERKSLRDVEVPDLDWFLDAAAVPASPYKKTFEQAKWEPLFVLHSSGSTGPPKPIIITHGSAETIRQHLLPSKDSPWRLWLSTIKPGTVAFVPMPYFHAAGINMAFLFNLFAHVPSIHPPTNIALSAGVVQDAVDHFDMSLAELPPSILESISQEEASLPMISKIPVVVFGGGKFDAFPSNNIYPDNRAGPLAEHAGEILSKYTFLVNIMGSTEAGVLPLAVPESSADSAWLRIPPGLPEFHFVDRGEGMYELVYKRDPNARERLHSCWYSFPDADEYPSKDLYVKHPTREGLWKLVARTDDVIVLSNGEKVVGIPIEGALHESPNVEAAVVLGHGHFQVAALVEPTPGAREKYSDEELLKRLKPQIDQAISLVPGHARLAADHVMFTKVDRPMHRTPKGTVVRKATLAMYEAEINQLYESAAKEDASDETAHLKLFGANDAETEKTLREILTQVTEAKDIGPEQDFFAAGVDSLQVLTLVKRLKTKVRGELPVVDVQKVFVASFVYSHPTIRALAGALRSLRDPSAGKSDAESHHRAMEDMLAKYTKGIPQSNNDGRATVLLTGSTGSLGSYLLDALLALDRVKHVYALNRSEDAAARQRNAHCSRGLTTDFDGRVTFLHADLAHERLGLDGTNYSTLVASVTHIIHSQWPVDFNLALASFEPHVRGVRRLIDLAAAGVHRPRILFTSSVSTCGRWTAVHPGERVPERLIRDVRAPMPMGYAEGKYVAEHLLAAARSLGVGSDVVHVGQLAGPVERESGMWNKQEWFPSLVASSKHLGLIPSSLGSQATVDWVPVDLAAQILLELAGLTAPQIAEAATAVPRTQVYNLVNPTEAPWRPLVRALQRRFPSSKVVDYNEWLEADRASAKGDKADPAANPAIKLLEFFEGLGRVGGMTPAFEMRETAKRSRTMRVMQGVSEEWVDKWLSQWRF